MRLTVKIGDEDGWIDVKERLTVLDERSTLDFSVLYAADGTPQVQIGKNAVAKAAARLKAWHLPGIKPLPVAPSFEAKVAALDALYPEVFAPIAEAVRTFEQELEAKAAAEKATKEAEANPTPDGGTA